jgi:hypothetical protein
MRVCLTRTSEDRRRTSSEITNRWCWLNASDVVKGLTITRRRRNIPTFLVFRMLSKVSLSDAMLLEVCLECLDWYGSVDEIV